VDDDQPKGYIEYPPEFLHSLNESGLPPHELKITQGCPVILTRNLNPAAGLCNGTRMTVQLMHKNILECKIISGEYAGKVVFIPKVTLTSSKFPFTLFRKQFPLKPCFAMTINKSQGQTIDFVGIDLTDSVFTHGMTYVAFSRARSWEFIKVAVNPAHGNKVKNIVWKEVLI
jgi:ATP-dependent DNA helicase PIF1